MASELRDTFSRAAEELTGTIQETSLGTIQTVMSGLGEIKEGGSSGAELKQLVEGLSSFQSALQATLDDPSELAPSGGCFSFCAQWYAGRSRTKLGQVKSEALAVLAKFQDLSDTLSPLMMKLSGSVNDAMPAVAKEVNELLALPSILTGMAEQLERGGLTAARELDMAPIQRSFDVSPVEAPLQALTSAKQEFGSTVADADRDMKQLSDFLDAAPSKVRAAFDVAPCLPVESIAPEPMKKLLSSLDVVKALDLNPLLQSLGRAKEGLDGFDEERVRQPLEAFCAQAQEKTAGLVQALEASKSAGQAQEVAQALQSGDVLGGMKKMGNLVGGLL